MSDSDADDSGFDREAERERLREKYENDQEDREQTQRMSELLLQGATMTNQHCDSCGNPIFRYDGQEFCAVCQQQTAAQAGADGDRSDNVTVDEESAEPSDSDDPAGEATPTRVKSSDPDAVPSGPAGRPDRSETGESGRGGQGDLATARAAITRTLITMAQRAESADDIRRTREYLEATRDAADALAAIDQLR